MSHSTPNLKRRARRRPQPQAKPTPRLVTPPHAADGHRSGGTGEPSAESSLLAEVRPRLAPPGSDPGFAGDELAAVAAYGHDLYRADCLDDARVVFEGLTALNPQNGYYQRALAEVCLRQGDLRSALSAANLAVTLDKRSAEARLQRSLVLLASQRTKEARADLQFTLRLSRSGGVNSTALALASELLSLTV